MYIYIYNTYDCSVYPKYAQMHECIQAGHLFCPRASAATQGICRYGSGRPECRYECVHEYLFQHASMACPFSNNTMTRAVPTQSMT